MSDSISSDRRTFLRRGAMGAGAFWMFSLPEFAVRQAYGQSMGTSPYGPISPKIDQTTGLPLIQLPDGFKYWSYSWTGDTMSDGVACPNLHDGMAVVDYVRSSDSEAALGDDDDQGWRGNGRGDDDDRRQRSSKIILVRNHEGDVGQPYL